MLRSARRLTLALGVLAVALLGAGRVTAQAVVVSPPSVSYYAPAPTVTYYRYGAPVVSYYSPPVLYTPAPVVSYYAPAVTYYAGPTAVTTTRYGLFGRPRVSTTYYSPGYVWR